MAGLSAADQQRVANGLNRFWSHSGDGTAGIVKADILAAVVATDSYQDSTAANYNAALPLPFKTAATTAMKTTMFVCVALMRWTPSWLIRLIGVID